MELASNEEEQKFNAPKPESAPWLVFIPDDACNENARSNSSTCQVFYSISERKAYVKEVMSGYDFWSFPQGWILMQESNPRKCYLWNPTISVKTNIHPCKWDLPSDAWCWCAMSSSPLEPNSCRIMCLTGDGKTFFVYNLESGEWVRHDIQGRPYSHLIMVNGKFYATTSSCKLAVIDLIPSFTVRVLEEEYSQEPIGREFSDAYNFVESSGEMFCVSIFSRYSDDCGVHHVSVTKRDCLSGNWNPVHQIGNRAFFLTPYGFAASRSANEALNIKGNCVYFLHGDERCLYIFDMTEGTLQVEAPCPQFLHKGSSTFITWIMPSN